MAQVAHYVQSTQHETHSPNLNDLPKFTQEISGMANKRLVVCMKEDQPLRALMQLGEGTATRR
jgi:hypothetical protein